MKYYSIKIPEPCHEDWNTMAPEEKGRYCDACSKTVIDFTKMNSSEIQDFIHQNIGNRICGHFKQTQLDSINIRVPSLLLERQLGFHKLFLITLLIVMGSSLFNCTNKQGENKKIDSIEIVDERNNETIDVTLGLPFITEFDSLPKKEYSTPYTKDEKNIEISFDGDMIVGDINYNEKNTKKTCSISDKDSLTVDGEIDITGLLVEESIDDFIGFIVVENAPEFKNTPNNLSVQEKKDYFQKRISEFVSENYNTNVCLEMKGKQKVFTQFKVDTTGHVVDIKVRAPHQTLEKEAKRVIGLLPQFIPAQQRGKAIKVVYTLPIVFQLEE